MAFRPDWEAVIGPVVDFALTRPEVDPKRIALIAEQTTFLPRFSMKPRSILILSNGKDCR